MRYSRAITLALVLIATPTESQTPLPLLGAGQIAGGGGPPPVCAGAIDLSLGCALPMLGGL
jgi:hypothetical protein